MCCARSQAPAAGYNSGIADVFYNTGVVEVQVGNLFFNEGGSNSGSNWVWAGATLGFGGGTNILDGLRDRSRTWAISSSSRA